MIEEETVRLPGSVPQAIDNTADQVNEMPKMTYVNEKELAFKPTRKVLEAAISRLVLKAPEDEEDGETDECDHN